MSYTYDALNRLRFYTNADPVGRQLSSQVIRHFGALLPKEHVPKFE